MKHISLLALSAFFALSLLVSSCNKEEDKVSGHYSHGLFITNEGPFQNGTGTITYFNPDSNKTEQDIFEAVNGRPLGNVVQSLTFFNDKGYIVVNNAGKVEVVDGETFRSLSVISGLELPRYFLGISDKKAYITDWSDKVQVLDLATQSVVGSIPTGTGPENMLKSGKYVYVLNAGGFAVDSTITVIDFSTDKVVKTLKVYDRPTGIVEDASGKVWVMCSGKGFNGWPMPGDSKGHLLRIDPATLAVDFDYPFEDVSNHPEKLVISGQTLYFLYNGGIYKYNTTFAGGSPVKLAEHLNLYGLALDAANSLLLVSDPVDYQSMGWVYRYRISTGEKVDSIQAGVIPGNMIIR